MASGSKPRPRKFSTTEWILIGMLVIGIILIALRWDYISQEVSESVRSYFEKAQ